MTALDDLLATCVLREPLPEAADGSAKCGLVQRLAGSHQPVDARVSRDVCEACLRRPQPVAGRVNAVVASVLHRAVKASQISEAHADFHAAELRFLRVYAARCLDVANADGIVQPENYELPRHVKQTQDRRTGYVQNWRNALRAITNFTGPRQRAWPRVGLVGWNVRTGLGYQNWDIAAHLPIVRWLVPKHPAYDWLPVPRALRRRVWQPPKRPTTKQLNQWLAGLDWLLFVENPLIPGLTKLAKAAGVRVACVCNWELTCPLESSWLPDLDLVICPTRFTLARLQDWKERFGFPWRLAYMAWPIDVHRIPYRQRKVCQRFVFVNGNGGCRGKYANQVSTPYRRKGLEVLLAAARLASHVPLILYSQTNVPPTSANVEVRQPPADNADLYLDGDVCVQPSHWEGLGLPLLECQAAGMPLITTDAPPMNEHHPFRTIPVTRSETVYLAGSYPVPSRLLDPRMLAETMASVFGSQIGEASYQARRFIEEEHSWGSAAANLQRLLEMNDPPCGN